MKTFPPELLLRRRSEFVEKGESIMDFCTKRKVDYNAVLSILYGRAKGSRGEAHRAAVALGLKQETAGAA